MQASDGDTVRALRQQVTGDLPALIEWPGSVHLAGKTPGAWRICRCVGRYGRAAIGMELLTKLRR
jgi:hypothetical protein